jgi:hypothetical protein
MGLATPAHSEVVRVACTDEVEGAFVAFVDTSDPRDFLGERVFSAAIFNDELVLQLEENGQVVINRATGSLSGITGTAATVRCTWEI